jgi:molybdopterin-guanine dinucleotide biosynthesis protein A
LNWRDEFMAKRAAIILAGGQAKRFQVKPEQWEDKALAMLLGKPLLVHIIERISDAIEEIVVCANDEARKARFSEVLREYSIRNVRICTDEKTPYAAGPLVAIATGLKITSADYCLTLPCDVPLIQPKVVDYLFNVVRGSYVAVPIWPDGGLESLMMVFERPLAVQIADALCKLRRRRPDDMIRGASKVLFVSTVGDLRNLDPEYKSFININLREDLTRLPTRVVKKGPVQENLRLNIGSLHESELKQLRTATRYRDKRKFLEASSRFSSFSTRLENAGLNFWAGASSENEGEILFNLSRRQEDTELKKNYHIKGKAAFVKATKNYGFEAETYAKNNISFLAKHARTDQSWCQQRANAESGF